MNEKVRKGIVYGLLIVAIGWGANQFLSNDVVIEPDPNAPRPTKAQLAIAAGIPAVEKTINVAEMKNKQWGEDPFRSVVNASAKTTRPKDPKWKLSGIVYNSSKPLAIINGKSVTVGDKIGDTRIVEIGRKSVIIERSGTRITLTVSKG